MNKTLARVLFAFWVLFTFTDLFMLLSLNGNVWTVGSLIVDGFMIWWLTDKI